MGGRGGASGFPANAPVPAAPQNAADTHDLAELSQYMKDTHSIRIDPSTFANQDFENVKQAAAAIEAIVREFPQAAANFHELRGEKLKHGTMASASYRGIIRLADYYFQTRNGLMQNTPIQNNTVSILLALTEITLPHMRLDTFWSEL